MREEILNLILVGDSILVTILLPGSSASNPANKVRAKRSETKQERIYSKLKAKAKNIARFPRND